MRTRRRHHAADRDRRGTARWQTRRAELAAARLVGQPAVPVEAALAEIHRRRLWFLQSHAGGGGEGATRRRKGLAELFQIRLRSQSVGPAGLVVSPPLSAEGHPAALRRVHAFGPARASTITTSIRSTEGSRSISLGASRISKGT